MFLVVTVMLVIVAVIHLLPLLGVLGSDRLTALYGLPFEEPNLVILMRHRAVLFGLLGAFLLYAAFVPEYQLLALVAGFVSVLSFLFLAWSEGDNNIAIRKVVLADWLALFCLVLGSLAYLVNRFR